MAFVKIMRTNETHYGFTFKTGSNTDRHEWNTREPCSPGGFYFCRREDALVFSTMFSNAAWVREVRSSSEVHTEAATTSWPVKFKAHTIELGEREAIDAFVARTYSADELLAAVATSGEALRFVTDQTPELCLAAVTQNGAALAYVKDKTPELCLAAVTQRGAALQFVKQQTPDICLAAVTQNGYALEYVKQQAPEICLAAVTKHCCALKYVIAKTTALCTAAVAQCRDAAVYC